MTKEQRIALAKEVIQNMDLTKEQYIEMCKMCDELRLVPKDGEPVDPEELPWEDILNE